MRASRTDQRVLVQLRRICLALPETREVRAWGNPTFQAGKKSFAVLDEYHGRRCIALKTEPSRKEALLQDERFFRAPYGDKHGWVCLAIDGRLDWEEVESLVLHSYRQVALKRMMAKL